MGNAEHRKHASRPDRRYWLSLAGLGALALATAASADPPAPPSGEFVETPVAAAPRPAAAADTAGTKPAKIKPAQTADDAVFKPRPMDPMFNAAPMASQEFVKAPVGSSAAPAAPAPSSGGPFDFISTAQRSANLLGDMWGLRPALANLRWVQSGFVSNYGAGQTPRNLMGFKDGAGNPDVNDAKQMDAVVWAGEGDPDWMRGGTYIVIRRARIALEHWDRTNVGFQEQTFGRQKLSGAPLGGAKETDPIDLGAKTASGDPLIPENSHVRIAHEMAEARVKVLRRSYSYNDGANMTAERWPPWRQGMEFDAGLVFVCFQRDLRTGFIPIFASMSRFDMMNQFVTNTGGAHFACPAGAAPGDYVGRALLES